jgi:hypothetical protein
MSARTWDLILAAQTCLQRISTANGFFTNAGAAVSIEPAQIPADAALALALVLESLAAGNDPGGRIRQGSYTADLLVVIKVSTTQTDAQQRMHEVIDDVLRAFIGQEATFPNGITLPKFIESRPIPPAEGLLWVGAELRFSAQINRA